MPGEKQDGSQIVSVRLPQELIQRLDRYLDWSTCYRRVTSSRNAAIREALGTWLDDQEQLAGFLEPQAQRQQFQAAYQNLSPRHTWVLISRLRPLLPWPRERFDAVLEELRADHHVELDSAAPDERSDPSHPRELLCPRPMLCQAEVAELSWPFPCLFPPAQASRSELMKGAIASCLQPRYNRRSLPHTLGNRLSVMPPAPFAARWERPLAWCQSMTISPQQPSMRTSRGGATRATTAGL